MERISLVVYAAEADAGANLVNRLSESAFADVSELVSDIEELASVVRDQGPDLLFVELGQAPALVLEKVSKLPLPRPQLVVAGPQDDSNLILAAMRIGVREFLSPEAGPSVLHTLIEKVAGELSAEGARAPAPIVAVIGAKGGVGATFIACQLAAELQEKDFQSAVVDLNLPIGDVALHFDLRPSFTLTSAASEGTRIDATSLRSILQPHSSGVQVLAAPSAIDHGHDVRPHHIERILQVLRHQVNWVVLDVPRGWSDESVVAMDQADQILVVTTNDVVALSHTRAYLELLDRLGFGAKVKLVLNLDHRRNQISESDCKELLARAPDIRLPQDDSAVTAVGAGELLSTVSPRGSLRKAVTRLAKETQEWCGVEEVRRSSGIGGRIRGLLGRSRRGAD